MGLMKRRMMEQQTQDETWEDRPRYPSSAEASEDEGTKPLKLNKSEIKKEVRAAQSIEYTTKIKHNLAPLPPWHQKRISTFCPSEATSIDLSVTSGLAFGGQAKFEWKCNGLHQIPLARNVHATVDFYFVDSKGYLQLIAHVPGGFIDAWPTPSAYKINANVPWDAVDKAEKESNGLFKVGSHSDYVVRLSFTSSTSTALPLMTDASRSKDSVRQQIAFNSTPHPFDVRFVFTTNEGKDEQSLWTSSELLKRSSTFFENLFNPELSSLIKKSDDQRNMGENMNGGDSDMSSTLESLISDDDSDAGIDETTFEAPSPSHEPLATFPYYRLQISDAACTTYKAVLTYLQFSHIHFAPLTSSFEPLPEDMRHLARLDYLSKHTLEDPLLPYPASPKSIYRLAHSLDLNSLSNLALSNYSSQLSPSNVAFEMMDSIIDEHEEVCQVLVEYLVKNWNEIVEDGNFKELLEKVKKDEVALSGALVAKLLPLLRGRGLNVEGRVIGSLNG